MKLGFDWPHCHVPMSFVLNSWVPSFATLFAPIGSGIEASSAPFTGLTCRILWLVGSLPQRDPFDDASTRNAVVGELKLRTGVSAAPSADVTTTAPAASEHNPTIALRLPNNVRMRSPPSLRIAEDDIEARAAGGEASRGKE